MDSKWSFNNRISAIVYLLSFFVYVSHVTPTIATISKSAREYQLGSDEMSKCYKTQLDANNPSHSCKYILSNQSYIADDTSCIASVWDILPVQYCIGASIVNCKKDMFERMISLSVTEYVTYQNNNPTPAMLYYQNNTDKPGIYIFNHQHMANALARSNIIPNALKYLKICIVKDLRQQFSMNQAELFWNYMITMGYSFPFDKYYNYKNPLQYMPSNILQLSDDPFRSLSIYVEDYEGFIYCGNPNEDVNALNYSKCFARKGLKWNKKYDNVGLTLLWSDFLWNKLKNNKIAISLYNYSNCIKEQMKGFRKLLPIAMHITLNRSDGSHKMPSFNNQPWKVNMNDLVLYENGCDLIMQQSTNWTQLITVDARNGNANTMFESLKVNFMQKYLFCVCIAGIFASMVRLCRERRIVRSKYGHIFEETKNNYGTIP